MDSLRSPRSELAGLVPYSDKEVTAEVMLASNEHPSDLPPEIADRLAKVVRTGCAFNRYPDPMASELRALIAEANGLEPGNVLIGNGGDELILNLLLAWGGAGRSLLDLPPTFVMYSMDAHITGTRLVELPRAADFEIDGDALLERLGRGDIDLVFIANPNNPTGGVAPETLLIDVLNVTDALVLVDEAYFEFSRHTMRPHMERHPNLVILRTFSKAFCLAGLRVGYLLAHEDVIRELTKVRQPYSVDRFSQTVASTVFRERVAFEAGLREIVRQRAVVEAALARMTGVSVYPSEANFVLFRTSEAHRLWRALLEEHSILVRDFSGRPLLEDCLRVTIGTETENRRFLDATAQVLAARES